MKYNGVDKLYIRKRTVPQWLVTYIIVLSLLIQGMIQFLHIPDMIKYTVDVVWIFLLLIMLPRDQIRINKHMLPMAVCVFLFFLLTLVVYLFRFQSVFYYLWGFRNNFRFYVAFFAFYLFMEQRDAEDVFSLMETLFWVNLPICMVQYFVMGCSQDYLGGIFGVERGCNASMNNFFCIVICRSILRFMNKEEGMISCFAKCTVSLLLAALAELKVYFLIFTLIAVMAAVMTSFSFRKLVLLLLGAVTIMIGTTILTALFDSGDFLNIERLIAFATSTSYSSNRDLGRLTAIPTLSRTILTDLTDQLFGLGLGNCDTAGFALLETPFFRSHSYLHYNWFSSAFLYLETGYIGLGLYLLFFVLCYCQAQKLKRSGTSNLLYCQITSIMAVVNMIMVVYNASLRSEPGYIMYFAMALPFIRGNVNCRAKC